MPNSTTTYYDANAEERAESYETVDFKPVLAKLLGWVPAGGLHLEIGCGSGRDAAFYLESGHDVTALDGSKAMLAEAKRRHRELAGRLIHHELPAPLPFADESFDIVTAMATIMHLSYRELPQVFGEIARVTRTGAVVGYSVNTFRAGLDGQGDDEGGRHFTCLPSGEWQTLHEAAGLSTLDLTETADITGRDGVRWATFVCRKA